MLKIKLRNSMKLPEESLKYFGVFGFLHLRDVFSSEEMQILSDSFEILMDADLNGNTFEGTERHQVYGFIEQCSKLTSLLSDNRVYSVVEKLLGKMFIWIGSDGNRYAENTGWHPDGSNCQYKRIKIIFYLDKLTKDSGALRVIPGSHIYDFHQILSPLIQRKNSIKTPFGVRAPKRENDVESGFGVKAWEVPCTVLETSPGDMVIFDQNLWHSSFFGAVGRRMFTLSFGEYPKNEDDIAFIKNMYDGQLSHIKNRQVSKRDYVYGKLLNSKEERIRNMTSKLLEFGFK